MISKKVFQLFIQGEDYATTEAYKKIMTLHILLLLIIIKILYLFIIITNFNIKEKSIILKSNYKLRLKKKLSTNIFYILNY